MISSLALCKPKGFVNGTEYTFSVTAHSCLFFFCPDGTNSQDYWPNLHNRSPTICFSGCFKWLHRWTTFNYGTTSSAALNVQASLSGNRKNASSLLWTIWHPLLKSAFTHMIFHVCHAFVDTHEIFFFPYI